jgi:CHASE3 domain sensor protein
MKVSIRLQIWLGFALALLIMSGIGLVAYTNTTRLVTTAGWVKHSHEILQALEAVLVDLVALAIPK